MDSSNCLTPSLTIENDLDSPDGDDDDFKRILFPILSTNISPLRPSITSPSYHDTKQYKNLFFESCIQIQEQIAHHRWPFCPIYLLHINTYCDIDSFSIPAEIALVETTFWPQLYGSNNDVQSMNISRKINEHYERHSHLYKRFCSITDDFHDFVHPGDQLPTGYQADILEHSRRTHGIPCTPNEKIGTQDYNQLLDDLNEMLDSLCDFRKKIDDERMPMFCTMESFWSTKAALDWIYDQPSTRDRLDDYTLYPIEALIAVIYENFYNRAQFKCDLGILMGKTPQQPVLHSRACDYHAILENKYCAMAHVRDLASYYTSLMAYLFYTYCDHNSSTLLPYIKVTYHGSLALQREAYWSGRKDEYKRNPNKNSLKSNCTLSLSSSSSDASLNDKLFENTKNSMKTKKYENNRNNSTKNISCSNLNPLAIPFLNQTEQQQQQTIQRSTDSEKTPAQLVLFEPRPNPSRERSCQTIYQRIHHRPCEDWD
ncbi:unnamed protein product [Adineta steineri]|uniref:Maelstrom domain-containing protein n=2 Tax=Adineta steineri TaxID=433720 RepID=A0A815H8D7_9BILA|nr:unnamed protein product [Adineta steineri]CAF3621202.1 unnamed protein product [Adineta steineri]